MENYRALRMGGAILVAEQITDAQTYRLFRERVDAVVPEYVSGERGDELNAALVPEIISSHLVKKADFIVKTASGEAGVARETSTDLAGQWIRTYLERKRGEIKNFEYDTPSGRVILTQNGRRTFMSFEDMVASLQGMGSDTRLAIAIKCLSDQNGLLTSERGKDLLCNTLQEGLDLGSDFLVKLLTAAVRKGDVKVAGLPVAKMLVPFLFRSLKAEAVDLGRIGRMIMEDEDEDGNKVKLKARNRDYYSRLGKILRASTRELRYFGHQYRRNQETRVAKMAQESDMAYAETLKRLRHQIVTETEAPVEAGESRLPRSVEAMIKAGETSPIIVRSMQMAVQLMDFAPPVKERLAQTQDSMQGVKKLWFWENLLTKAEGDPELARFMEHDLISLDAYLGGGSLFTTYGATVRSKVGGERQVVVKMLNPNAEEFINLSHDFCSAALGEVELSSSRESRQRARNTKSLLDLANVWCIKDINDPDYIERDEAFRETIESFNQERGSVTVEAPARGYTSKKVKIEDQCEGTTLNRWLSNRSVSEERKRETVGQLLEFFDYQFEHSPATAEDGSRVFVFHSDPHAGNYMVNPELASPGLGVIDRSMYLTLNEREVEMFRLLKDEGGVVFVNSFVGRCLEINGVEGREASGVRNRILTRLGGEKLRQKISGRENSAEYLQIIMQEFANYGERYYVSGDAVGETDEENRVLGYLKGKPKTEILVVYKAVKGKTGVSYKEFYQTMETMREKGMVARKAIEAPLEYRLMIRNITAMQQLKKRWMGKRAA